MNYLIYHNDNDGMCSASIMIEHFSLTKENTKLFMLNYKKPLYEVLPSPKELTAEDKIIMVDYNISNEENRDYLGELLRYSIDIFWVDHHEDSCLLEGMCPSVKYIPGIRSREYSAAMLCYFIYKNKIIKDKYGNKLLPDRDSRTVNENALIRAVHILDTFDFPKMVSEEEFDTEYSAFKYAIDLSNIWNNMWVLNSSYAKNKYNACVEEGLIALKYIDKQYSYYRSQAFGCTVNGLTCIVANAIGNGKSVFGNKIYKEHDMCCTFSFDGREFIYNFYTWRDDLDLREIATRYGGGGHKKACGFRTKEMLLTDNINIAL